MTVSARTTLDPMQQFDSCVQCVNIISSCKVEQGITILEQDPLLAKVCQVAATVPTDTRSPLMLCRGSTVCVTTIQAVSAAKPHTFAPALFYAAATLLQPKCSCEPLKSWYLDHLPDCMCSIPGLNLLDLGDLNHVFRECMRKIARTDDEGTQCFWAFHPYKREVRVLMCSSDPVTIQTFTYKEEGGRVQRPSFDPIGGLTGGEFSRPAFTIRAFLNFVQDIDNSTDTYAKPRATILTEKLQASPLADLVLVYLGCFPSTVFPHVLKSFA